MGSLWQISSLSPVPRGALEHRSFLIVDSHLGQELGSTPTREQSRGLRTVPGMNRLGWELQQEPLLSVCAGRAAPTVRGSPSKITCRNQLLAASKAQGSWGGDPWEERSLWIPADYPQCLLQRLKGNLQNERGNTLKSYKYASTLYVPLCN